MRIGHTTVGSTRIPRHCTGCGGRIISLTRQSMHANSNPARLRDLCNDCEPDADRHDRWQIATIGGTKRRADL
jgi:hypothetical protein